MFFKGQIVGEHPGHLMQVRKNGDIVLMDRDRDSWRRLPSELRVWDPRKESDFLLARPSETFHHGPYFCMDNYIVAAGDGVVGFYDLGGKPMYYSKVTSRSSAAVLACEVQGNVLVVHRRAIEWYDFEETSDANG